MSYEEKWGDIYIVFHEEIIPIHNQTKDGWPRNKDHIYHINTLKDTDYQNRIEEFITKNEATLTDRRGHPLQKNLEYRPNLYEHDKKKPKPTNKTTKQILEETKKPEGKKEYELQPTETIKEPVLNDNNPKWLIIRNKSIVPNDPRPTKQRLEDPLPTEKEIEFETRPPNIWQCQKCMGEFEQETTPHKCIHCNRESKFEIITKDINIYRWKLPLWKDIPIEELDMILLYHDILDLIKKCIVFPEEMQYELFTLWIIASYKKESFDTIPFLIFRGLIESGKTRGLDLIRELGYHMVHTTGATFAAMCRLTHYYGAGVLIDEIDNKIDKRTESGRDYLDFLKPSYRRGSIYICADKDDQSETREYNNYGFKAFAGEQGGYDQAVFSRSIDFQMEQAYPEVPDLKYIQNDLDQFQTLLLNYRYKYSEPTTLPLDYPLKGRSREIFSALIQTANHIGLDESHILAYIQQRKQEQIDEIQDTDEYSILEAIYRLQHGQSRSGNATLDDSPESLSYEIIVTECGWDDGTESGKKKGQKLGYIFKKKLQLKNKRRGRGKILLLNDPKNHQRLQNLYRRYHIK